MSRAKKDHVCFYRRYGFKPVKSVGMRTIKEVGDYEMVSLLVVLQHSFLKSTHKFAVQVVCISGSLSRSDLHNPDNRRLPAGSAQFEVQGLRVTRRCRRGRTARPSGSSPNTCWQCSRPVPKIAADERIVLVLTKSRLGIVSPQVPTALLFFAGQMCRGGGRE